MLECQFRGMQGLSLKALQRRLRREAEPTRARFEARAVNRISQQGMTDVRHMHADLMGSTGFERKPQQAGPRFAIGQGEVSSTS